MKLSRLMAGLCLLVVILLFNSCEPVPVHMFYIDDSSCMAKSADGDIIDPFWVYPGDWVIWINTSGTDLTVTFSTDAIFGVTSFTVAKTKRVKMQVKSTAAVLDDYRITPCSGAPGTPKGKVSEDP